MWADKLQISFVLVAVTRGVTNLDGWQMSDCMRYPVRKALN